MNGIWNCVEGFISPFWKQNPDDYMQMGASKKQDDYGNEAIQIWLEKYKVEPTMHKWPTSKIEDFVANFIKDLPKNQITNANIDSVKLRFKNLSKACSRASNYLFEKIKELEGIDTVFRKTLVETVISSSSDKF